MTEPRFPWERPLLEAQLETDLEKVAKNVEAAETAIFLRQSELRDLPDGQQEIEALNQAARDLLRIETEKLSWPPLELNGPSATN
jgi:hypothetical protein